MNKTKTTMKRRTNLVETKPIVGPELNHVLTRIAKFFTAAGATDEALRHASELAIKQARSRRSAIRYVALDSFIDYNAIMHVWCTNAAYRSATGIARALPLKGQHSIASLVKVVGLRETVEKVAKNMREAGSLRRRKDGLYDLPRGYVNWVGAKNNVPYEPAAEFLLRAVVGATTALRPKRSTDDQYWLLTYCESMPAKLHHQFLAFARLKSEHLMNEFNDWFGSKEVVASPRRGDRRTTTMGIGLFPYIGQRAVGRAGTRFARQ